MARSACAVALWCAVLSAAACASAYTVDCNHEYTDCYSELSKLTSDDEELPLLSTSSNTAETITTASPTQSTPTIKEITPGNVTEAPTTEFADTESRENIKPKPRLLNLNVDELQNFANALHNQTNPKEPKKSLTDLSDVNLDGEDEDETPKLIDNIDKHKQIPDKFYTNLQVPFHPLLNIDRISAEVETCKENEVSYRVGEKMDRGCEETCECTSGGTFECAPRCKHPYIRRGRRLNDPLCFESPVDDCCSIIACATGNGETKPVALEVCRYGNDTHPVGVTWNVGCEQTCSCERNSVVTCKPRCKKLPQSDKCINVQDPNDECCEVQICDVSQDVHEEPFENVTSSTSTTTEGAPRSIEEFMESKSATRPLVLSEPIGSVKVLQNNTVQVNLIHLNSSKDPIHLLLSSDGGKTFQDVELKYSNLILNLEGGKDYILKTKETGTKFNFTITATDVGAEKEADINEVPLEESINTAKVGCHHDGQFYAVGEEFHIGCTELCECTGADTRECAPLVCPNHVGLELVSKSCVRWATNPPPQPPNCCPRAARCLSDGTCHYKGVAIPNWSEVPISLTGCEEHCFCENGELDCQEACSPLPPIPPQTLRCPPMHRPVPVNISDEDCCKQWGCIPHAGNQNGNSHYSMIHPSIVNYVTPIVPLQQTFEESVLPTPPATTESTDFYRHLSPVKTSLPKFIKTSLPVTIVSHTQKYMVEEPERHVQGDNITVFTLDDIESPFKTIHPEPPLVNNWEIQTQHRKPTQTYEKPRTNFVISNSNTEQKPIKFTFTDNQMHDLIQHSKPSHYVQSNTLPYDKIAKEMHDTVKKIPLSHADNYFFPAYDNKHQVQNPYMNNPTATLPSKPPPVHKTLSNQSNHPLPKLINNPYNNGHRNQITHNYNRKQVTILRNKDLKAARPIGNTDSLWTQDTKMHVLTKNPNPYETVLYRVPTNEASKQFKTPMPSKAYSTLELEHLLSQMEVESEVNRNLGRSADNSHGGTAAGHLPPGFPANPPHPQAPFIPTVPPENRYPQEDIPDYDQNNIPNPRDPVLSGLPPGLPLPPNYGDENKKLSVISLQGDSPTSVKMLFGLPPVLVGLRGSVDLRYTDSADDDISNWNSQVFAPADEILTTPRLEFRLGGLKPSTTYKIRGKLYLHNLPVVPESEIYTVRTQDLPSIPPVEEKQREIDSKLVVIEVNDTTARVSWRHFTEDELQLIDGIQVRYRPVGTPIYSMTELLHHSRSTAELQELRPDSRYEASLVLIPPPRTTTELIDPGRVEFTTAPYSDPYNWSIVVEARNVGAEAAELTWRGIPAPAERWVRVYRAAHDCGASRKEHDAFRLATRDVPPTITLTGLVPDTKCRVWLELFLTNGKVKTSNVLEIHTKSEDEPEPIDNVIEASSIASRGGPRGDYYGALVVVGVVAALAALAAALLLLVLLRRHRPHSVPITPVPSAPRDSSLPPYDNPAYKLELQQETMDL